MYALLVQTLRQQSTSHIISKVFKKQALDFQRPFSLASTIQAPSTSNVIIQEKIKIRDDLEINYGKIGQGPHVVVCLPGVFGTIESDFEPVMKKLNGNEFTILCLEPPGNGKSRPPAFNSGISPYSKDGIAYLELMKHLDIPKYSIVGWSGGGAAGMYMINQSPQNIDKFVFWGTPAFVDQHIVTMSKLMTDPGNWPPARWNMMESIYGKTEMLRMTQNFCDYATNCLKFGTYRVDGLLSSIKVPTLILHGRQDSSCPPDHPKTYNKLIHNSLLEVWPQGEHDIHLEFLDKFVKRLEKFLHTAK